eukprot:1186264-Prorocentrum_minimum.AAC.1
MKYITSLSANLPSVAGSIAECIPPAPPFGGPPLTPSCPSASPLRTLSGPPPNGTLAVPHCKPVLCTGVGFVQGTRTLHTELAPGNPGCSQRLKLAFWTFVPLMYCTRYNTP